MGYVYAVQFEDGDECFYRAAHCTSMQEAKAITVDAVRQHDAFEEWGLAFNVCIVALPLNAVADDRVASKAIVSETWNEDTDEYDVKITWTDVEVK